MSDGYLKIINTSTHRIGLASPYIRPKHSASFSTGLSAREYEKEEINRMLEESVIEPTKQNGFACRFRCLRQMGRYVLSRLSEVWFRHLERFLPLVKDRWAYRLIRKDTSLSETECQQWLFPNQVWQGGQREESFYLLPWLLSVYKNAFRSEERDTYVPTCDGRNIIDGQLAVRTRILGWYSHIPQDTDRRYRTHKIDTTSSKQSWWYTQAKRACYFTDRID